MLWRLPYLQVVRVSQLHLVVAVPAQQLVHGVLCKTLQHKQLAGEIMERKLNGEQNHQGVSHWFVDYCFETSCLVLWP